MGSTGTVSELCDKIVNNSGIITLFKIIVNLKIIPPIAPRIKTRLMKYKLRTRDHLHINSCSNSNGS